MTSWSSTSLHSVALALLLLSAHSARPALAQDAETATNVIEHGASSATESALRDGDAATTVGGAAAAAAAMTSSTPSDVAAAGVNEPSSSTVPPQRGQVTNAGAVDELVEQMLSKNVQPAAAAGNFGLTLGDLEDLREDEPSTLVSDPLRLDESVPMASSTVRTVEDSKNIYKVTSSRQSSEMGEVAIEV